MENENQKPQLGSVGDYLSKGDGLDAAVVMQEKSPDSSNLSYAPSLHKASNHSDGEHPSVVNPGDQEHDVKGNQKEENGELSQQTPEDDGYITGMRLVLVMAAVCLACFLLTLDISIIATAVPRITSDFHSLDDIGWYGSAYLLANASLTPLAGKIYTYFNTKWTFFTFFLIFEFGSLLCGVSQSSKMLIVSRAVAGAGSAGLINGALTIIACSLPLPKRPAYLGGMMAIVQCGVVIGPLIGGAFTEYSTWRWCFFVNLPVGGVVSICLILVPIPNNVRNREGSVMDTIRKKLDLIGFALFAPSVIQFFLALQYGGHQYPWNSSTVIGLFCGFGATFIIFLVWQHFKGEVAMIPFSLMKIQTVWTSLIYVFFFFGNLQLATYYLPIYFQAIKGATPFQSGIYLLPSILAQVVGAIGSGIAVTRLGYYTPWAIGCGMLAAVAHGLIATMSTSTSTGEWIGYQILLGFGRGIGMQMAIVAVQNSVPQQQTSIAMSMVTFIQMFGGAVIITLSDTVFSNSLQTYLPIYAPGVNPQAVFNAGATGLRALLTNPTVLSGVLIAYAKSVDHTFYLAVGSSCADFLIAWGMGWKDIRQKPAKTNTATEKEEA